MPRGHGREGDFPPAPDALPVAVADAHCHLDIMGVPVEESLARAAAVGVTRVVTIGVDVETSRWAADTAAAYDGVDAAVAVHPNDVADLTEAAYDEIAALAARPEVRAVGETGIDHFRTPEDGWRVQEEAFRRHIAIAKEHGKALVIHDRDAHADVLRVLREEGAPERTVFHCFSGDAALAKVCTDAGYVMSFAGNVTFKNAGDLRDALAVAPLDLLLVETDAPYLTPIPWRGRPNAPYLVPLTVRAMAQAKGVELEAMCTALAANTERVFGP